MITISEELRDEFWASKVYMVTSMLTEMFGHAHAEDGLTRDKLACLLKKNKSQITRSLRGDSNLTIRTISDMMLAMNADFRVVAWRRGNAVSGSQTATKAQLSVVGHGITSSEGRFVPIQQPTPRAA